MTPDRDKSKLFGPFANLLTDFERKLEAAGLPFHLFEGLRSWERQELLYAQGRTRPGKIVTRAKPGESFHFYGLAADYVLDGMLDKPDVQWSWDIKADLNKDRLNDWKQMAEFARAGGLESAYYWQSFPELPHVQRTYGLTIDRARVLYQRRGIEGVWTEAMDLIEKSVWPMH